MGPLGVFAGRNLNDLPMNQRRSVMDGYQEKPPGLLDPAADALQPPSVLGGLLSIYPPDNVGPQTFSKLGVLGMAMNSSAKNRLADVLLSWGKNQNASGNIRKAIDLTDEQRSKLTELLSSQYKGIELPASIPYKARHAFDSRVTKDGFSTDDVFNWSVAGSDDAAKAIDYMGKAALLNRYTDPVRGTSYDVRMPIRGDALGNVWADDVIPVGLFGPKKTR